MALVDRVRELVEEELSGSEYFLVDVVGGENSRKICVQVDGDEGISIDACARISRSLSEVIDDDSFESDPFILEVSSPGADKPLLNRRQFNKHIGRELIVDLGENVQWKGKLDSIDESGIQLSSPKGKKRKPGKSGKRANNNEPENVDGEMFISFDDIRQATVVLSFK